MVSVLLELAQGQVSKERAEDVVYRMFEVNMDEYLDEEVESLKQAFDVIVKTWSKSVRALVSLKSVMLNNLHLIEYTSNALFGLSESCAY